MVEILIAAEALMCQSSVLLGWRMCASSVSYVIVLTRRWRLITVLFGFPILSGPLSWIRKSLKSELEESRHPEHVDKMTDTNQEFVLARKK